MYYLSVRLAEMNMSYPERKKVILNLLRQKGKVSVQELIGVFNISKVTARRDLDALLEEELIERVHGGALVKEKSIFAAFRDKSLQSSPQKEQIGQLASQYIEDGDTIFLDCGSTVFQVCSFLRKKKNLRVITNSIPIMLALMENKEIHLNLIGGELDHERSAIHGNTALEHIKKYKANKAFIGIDGISLQRGLSSQSEKEQSISFYMAHSADKVYLLCDSSKFEKDAYVKLGGWDMVDMVITDDQLDHHLLQQYRNAGISIISK